MAFFDNFLAFFDTFTTRYNDSDMKLKFSGYFYSYKRFIQKSFLKMNQKCPSDLCAEVGGSSVWQISRKYFAGVIYS